MRVRGVCIILLLAILDTHLIHAVQYTYITGGVQGKSVAQGTGNKSWSNLANVGNGNLQDYALTASLGSSNTANALTITNYDFSVLSGLQSGSVLGVNASISFNTYTGDLCGIISGPSLVKNGGGVSGAKADVTVCATAVTLTNFGGNSDIWGFTSISVADVRSSNFGLTFLTKSTSGFLGLGSCQARAYDAYLSLYVQFNTQIFSVSPASYVGLNPSGTVISVVGTNFINIGTPTCKFGSQVVSATVINGTTITCFLPSQTVYGSQAVSISLDGSTYTTDAVAFSYNCNTALLCSGHGTCSATGQPCVCNPGWKGPGCDQPDCSSLSDCNNHGSCTAGPTCVCDGLWLGADCSQPSCISYNNCSGLGSCTAPNTCTCNPGYVGLDCSKANCSQYNDCNYGNGGGICSSPNNCTCNSGFTGPSCAASCDPACSGNNFCGSSNNCSFCIFPYQNPPTCDKSYTCVAVGNCNGNGQCIGQDQCQCVTGWSGTGCTIPDCSALDNCTGHGDCVGVNQCKCTTGWTNGNCNQTDCPDMGGCNANNGGGVCLGPNICQCNSGYLPPNCSEFSCSPPCGLNQVCGGPNQCTCKLGFIPPNCTDQYTCTGDCYSNGICIGTELCQCNNGYLAPDCRLADCSLFNNCSGNGVCTQPGVCTCNGGYSGGDCSQKTKSNSVLPIAIGASAGGVALVGAIVAGGFYTRKWRKNRKMRFTEPPYTQTVFGRYLDLHYDTKGRDLGYLTAFSSMLHRTGFELATSICQVASSTDREGVSRSLVHSLAAGDEDLIPLMTKLIDNEVEKAESEGTLFRANSMAVSLYQVYSKIFGIRFLWKSMGPFLVELNVLSSEEEEKNVENKEKNYTLSATSLSMEVDPNKMDDSEAFSVNKYVLLLTTQRLFSSIISRSSEVPVPLRVILTHLEKCVKAKYPNANYKAMGSFLFLRFIVPCVTTPHVYGIFQTPPGDLSQRRLTLLAKVLQNLANEVQFTKEPHMAGLNDFIVENLGNLHQFYDKLLQMDNVMRLHFGAMDIPENVKLNALMYLHSFCLLNKDKIATALQEAGNKVMAEEFTKMIDEMPEPLALAK